ncbi:30440_t:CDS:1, partial [Gigaspora margarita]
RLVEFLKTEIVTKKVVMKIEEKGCQIFGKKNLSAQVLNFAIASGQVVKIAVKIKIGKTEISTVYIIKSESKKVSKIRSKSICHK